MLTFDSEQPQQCEHLAPSEVICEALFGITAGKSSYCDVFFHFGDIDPRLSTLLRTSSVSVVFGHSWLFY